MGGILRWIPAAAVVPLALLPGTALANSGIGLFTPASILLVLGVIPIVLIEAPFLHWKLRVAGRRALFLSLWMNLASTLGGAFIGFVLDIALGSATGMMGSAGREGFVVALVLMFGLTLWIENWMLRTLHGAAAAADIFRVLVVANGVTYVLLAAWAVSVLPRDPMLPRARVSEVANAAGVAKTEAAEHYQAHGRFKPFRHEAPTKYTRRVSVEESGRIVAEIASPDIEDLDGKAFVWEPVLKDGILVEWRCYVPEAPLKYFPASCRYRDAKGR